MKTQTLLRKKQSITPWGYSVTSAKAAGQQQPPQASVWTSNCCECNMSSVPKIKTQCCLRKQEINMSGLSKAVLNPLQLNGNIWKKALRASVNHMLSWKSLSMARTCISAHCKETAFCSKQWITRLAAVLQEPKAALATPTEVAVSPSLRVTRWDSKIHLV